MRTFRFSFDAAQCINCGVCVDVCPVHCLDMTRPQAPGPEGNFARSTTPVGTQDWMMVFPIQVSRCTGCMVCTMECPADIITIAQVDDPVPFAPPQGPLVPEPVHDPGHWQALSTFTRMSRKHRPLGDPWGPEHKWRPVRRIANWRVWRTWRTNEDYARATTAASTDAAVHDESPRRHP